MTTAKKTSKAKPFLKWAGGKGQLIDEIDARLPRQRMESGEVDRYVEPFVGGGAVFFHICQTYDSIRRFYLLDINGDLVKCYKAIRENVEKVIDALERLESKYLATKDEGRRDFYYWVRDGFNSDRDPAKLIFLNKTCYNGLYRVNKNNEFNVPFGNYTKPKICDRDNLFAVARVLEKAIIKSGDFTHSEQHITKKTLVYVDPPYDPLSQTASFTSYSKGSFSEGDQRRLAAFYKKMSGRGAQVLLSNSGTDLVRDLYREFRAENVFVGRSINCLGNKRGKIVEVLVRNYEC